MIRVIYFLLYCYRYARTRACKTATRSHQNRQAVYCAIFSSFSFNICFYFNKRHGSFLACFYPRRCSYILQAYCLSFCLLRCTISYIEFVYCDDQHFSTHTSFRACFACNITICVCCATLYCCHFLFVSIVYTYFFFVCRCLIFSSVFILCCYFGEINLYSVQQENDDDEEKCFYDTFFSFVHFLCTHFVLVFYCLMR